jgi:hypothetical protein
MALTKFKAKTLQTFRRKLRLFEREYPFAEACVQIPRPFGVVADVRTGRRRVSASQSSKNPSVMPQRSNESSRFERFPELGDQTTRCP